MNAVLSPTPITESKPLEACVLEWMQAKHQEDAAKKRRLDLEDRILALQPAPEEGSATRTLDNGFKLTLTGKLSYKCDDVQALIAAVSQWPASMQPIKTDVRLDETGAKYLRKEDPAAWAAIAKLITVTPAKTAVKVSA
jgi:hypothetical protein